MRPSEGTVSASYQNHFLLDKCSRQFNRAKISMLIPVEVLAILANQPYYPPGNIIIEGQNHE
jgi:hypothetical protein